MILAALPLLLPQVPDPAAGPGGEEALELFRRVVAAQLVGETPGRVEGFRAKLNIRERGEQRREFDLQVLYRAADGGRIRLRVEDARRGTLVEKGLDDRGYWLRDEDGRLHDLSGRDYQQDRESLDAALDQAEELLLLLDLQRLRERARDLQAFQDETGHGLQGVLERRDGPWTFRLHVDAEARPLRLDLLPPPRQEGETGGPEAARFALLQPGVFDGRRMPRVIHEYRGEHPLPVRLLEVRALEWRRPPAASALARPHAEGPADPSAASGGASGPARGRGGG